MSETAVYCGCGAQWHGPWVEKSRAQIDLHEACSAKGGTDCEIVPHDVYICAFPRRCKCADCRPGHGLKAARTRRLNAASPCLLAALKAMVACVTSPDGAVSPEPQDRGAWLDALVTAREAIKKAEGR